MIHLDVQTARWLVSSDGIAAVDVATGLLDDGAGPLVVNTALRERGHAAGVAAVVLTSAVARQRARALWSDADRLLFTRESLEQASHPAVARWRAARFLDREVWDLCSGVGGDALELAECATNLTAVERDPGLAILLGHNLRVRGLSAQVLTADALEVTPPDDAVVHVDPARRVGGRRVKALRDHVPPVGSIVQRHGHQRGLAVVLSPAVDVADPDLPDAEVEFLQVGDRLVEAVAWTGSLRGCRRATTATLLPAGDTRHRDLDEPRARLRVAQVGDHLVEVVSAAVRARLHDEIGAEIGAWRLASHRALLTVDSAPPSSPWYRARPIVTVLSARPKAVRRWLRQAPDQPIEFAFHGLPGEADRWWRELGRPPRGPAGLRVELVRLDDRSAAIVTRAHTPDDAT